MERSLRPERFDVLADSSSAEKEFNYWLKTLQNYLEALPQENLDKLKVLTNHISASVYEYISEETTYERAIEALKKIFVKQENIVFARHLLKSRKQEPGETLDQYLQALKTLSKDCAFEAVDANTHRQQAIRDTFIDGIRSNTIRQRVLETNDTTLTDIFTKARSLEFAQSNVEAELP